MVKCFFKECQLNCLPTLTSLDSRKHANFSGGPCSLDNAMLKVSELHNLAAFSTLCTQDMNLLLLLPSNILTEFSMECCKAWVCKPTIWLCKQPNILELFGLCTCMPFIWLLLSVDFSYCWINLVEAWCSLEQYIGLKEDKLSSTTVDFIRSEGNLETKCLYWFSKPKVC